jgi:hypothetical protein
MLAGFGKFAPEGTIERLHGAGLIHRPINLSYLVIGSFIVFVGFTYIRSFYPTLNLFLFGWAPRIGYFATLAGIPCIVGLLFLLRYSPTEGGNRLCDLYKEYLNQD